MSGDLTSESAARIMAPVVAMAEAAQIAARRSRQAILLDG
jgi:hypothetical protein